MAYALAVLAVDLFLTFSREDGCMSTLFPVFGADMLLKGSRVPCTTRFGPKAAKPELQSSDVSEVVFLSNNNVAIN